MSKTPDKPLTPADGELDRATDPEYAAISPLAVVGLVLSLLGVAAFFIVPLLVLPLLGLGMSLAAYRKIRRSEGVLTGRLLARVGAVLGLMLALAASAYHIETWREQQSTLHVIEKLSYEILDSIAAGDYEKVYQMMPEDFRKAQAKGAEGFRESLLPFFKGAGQVTQKPILLTLSPIVSKEGKLLHRATMRLGMEHRSLDFTLWFMQDQTRQWQPVGVACEETFESMMKNSEAEPPAPLESPVHEVHEHEH
jgi:hypothetical protein